MWSSFFGTPTSSGARGLPSKTPERQRLDSAIAMSAKKEKELEASAAKLYALAREGIEVHKQSVQNEERLTNAINTLAELEKEKHTVARSVVKMQLDAAREDYYHSLQPEIPYYDNHVASPVRVDENEGVEDGGIVEENAAGAEEEGEEVAPVEVEQDDVKEDGNDLFNTLILNEDSEQLKNELTPAVIAGMEHEQVLEILLVAVEMDLIVEERRGFTKDQLRAFLVKHHVPVHNLRNKIDFVKAVHEMLDVLANQ